MKIEIRLILYVSGKNIDFLKLKGKKGI